MGVTCQVCMHEIGTDSCTLKDCKHTFCRQCIQQWIASRHAPLCPVCRAGIQGSCLILADGSELVAVPATAVVAEDADLSCLDHRYFLVEVGRLLSRANSVHNRLYQDAYCCGRKGGSRQTALSLDSVQEVLGALTSYKSSLEGEVRFDPEVLLADLYRLDRQLSVLSAGTAQGSSLHVDSSDAAATAGAGAGAAGSNRYASQDGDDYHHDYECYRDFDDDDHDDDDDDDWHPGLSKGTMLSRTPGRRPNSRHQRSSNQQQQQQRLQHRGR